MEKTRSIAKLQLQGNRVPETYVKELHRYLKGRPGESNFTVLPTPNKGYGSVTCLRPGCNYKLVPLSYDTSRDLGGFVEGIGSLSAYETHCAVYHAAPARPSIPGVVTPSHTPAQAGPSRPRSSILDQLDGRVAPNTLPRTVKREMDNSLPRSVPSKRGFVSLVDDDDDEDVIDLTIDDAPARARKKPKVEPTMKREPLDRKDVNNLAGQQNRPEDFDDDEVIDLTVDEIPTPASRKLQLAPIFKREAMEVEDTKNRALAQLGLPAEGPSTSSGLSPVRLRQVLANIVADQKRVTAEITQLMRKAKLGGAWSLSAVAQKEKELAELAKEEGSMRRELAASDLARPVSPLARFGNGGSSGLPKKEEPGSDDHALLALPTPGPSRPASRGFGDLPLVRPTQALPPPFVAQQVLQAAQQLPGHWNGLGQFVHTAAQGIGNGLHTGFHAMQNFAHMAAAHVPGGNIIGDAMDQLVGAGAPAFGPGRLWDDDGGEDVDDTFNKHDADAVNKFILQAGNASIFDENADVQKAMKGLGLENQQQLLPGMDCILLPHQLIAVKWMLDLETEKKYKRNGGILADEMGLGKTVQMIALMAKNPPAKDAPQGTLIVAPLSLLEQWKAEILDKTTGRQGIHIYHSTNPYKAKTARFLKEFDTVITTYGTLAGEMPKSMMLQQKPTFEDTERAKKDAGLLFQINWHRIVLDEAHNIRNRPTRTSQAVTHIKAKYRWCLTGTPVINSLADLYGYFRFIRLRPWDDWRHYYDHIAKIQKRQPQLASERAQGILQLCLLRRKKDSMLGGRRLIELTSKKVVQTSLDFSPEERQIYELVQGKVQAVFNRYLRAGTVLKNYSHILVLILRLKQLCCHPSLIQEQTDDPVIDDDKDRSEEISRAVRLMGAAWVEQLKAKLLAVMTERMKTEQRSLDEEIENDVCPVCFDTMTEPMVTACSHIYCRDCVDKLFEKPMEPGPEYKADERPCPSCRQPISQEKLFRRYAFEPSNADLAGLIGAPDVKADPFVKDEPYVKDEPCVKMERFVKEESDDDLDMPSVDDLICLGLSPKRIKGKGQVKEEVLKKEKTKKKRRNSSRPESDDYDSDDSIDDFIVHTDEDEEEKDRRQARSKKKGKQRAIKSDPLSEDEIIKLEDSENDSEADHKPIKPKMMLKNLPKMSRFLPSTKMKRMMESIKTWAQEYPTDKVMVLSQFTSCLGLVAKYLDENDVSYVRYQGDMKKNERDQSIYQFQRKRGGPRVMLMSLKAGGVGLNLTRANRVIALDLAWSEAVEHQAYDRVHRLGQSKDVLVERLVIKNTVEDELLKIQARKRALADGSLGEGGGRKMGRLSVREIAALFGIHDLHRR